MKRIVKWLGFIVFMIIAFLMTLYLISYNNFGFANIKNWTIIPANKITEFGSSDLLFLKLDVKAIQNNDKILFYNSYEAKSEILIEKVLEQKIENEGEKTYLLESERHLSSSYLIGKYDDIVKVPFLGFLVNILASRIGYVIFIISPLVIFLVWGIKELDRLKKAEVASDK